MNISVLTAGILSCMTPAVMWASHQGDPTHYPIVTFAEACNAHHVEYVDEEGVSQLTDWWTVTCPGQPVGVNR